MQKTITFRNVEIVVQTAVTVRDDVTAILISQRVQSLEPVGGIGLYDEFGELCAHVVSAKGLPFDPLGLEGKTAVEAHAAYGEFMAMHKTIRRRWVTACNEVDAADVDPVTGPVALPEDADPNS